ncbi:MAG: hypothetical protein CVU05_14675 [Bacteroidetes bacterium HGW-Bacteroidetes-21]|jgi:hypothetical protein|nr:MAG: hypothetical protein CVU05_14675 [Bacteroidetes bacterium HGW-Bacteroidetes-21]
MKKQIFNLFCFILLLFSVSCDNSSKSNATDLLNDSIAEKNEKVDDELIGQLITVVPNPLQLSELLQKSGVVYNSDLLVPSSNISKFNTNLKKAINLGTYGSDLVHMNIYERTVSTLTYLKNVNDLANDLKIGQFINFETLNRLSENKKNIDSILYITNSSFDKMTHYLVDEKRSNIAVLIAYGTWIENLYLATNIDAIDNIQMIYNRVGEQKVVLDNILILLGAFKEEPKFAELLQDAELLKIEFDKVKVTYNYVEPTMTEIDGKMVIVDNSTSSISIDEPIFKGIGKVVAMIRNKITN